MSMTALNIPSIAAPNCKGLIDTKRQACDSLKVNNGAHNMETDSGIILAVVLSFLTLAIGWRA